MKDVSQTLDPLLTTVNKSQTPAKKAKWHLGKTDHQLLVGLGRYSHYRYTTDTEINRYVSILSSCRTDTDNGDRFPKNNDYSGHKTIQKSTDTYRYGHHAVPIQIMVTDSQKTTTIPDKKPFFHT